MLARYAAIALTAVSTVSAGLTRIRNVDHEAMTQGTSLRYHGPYTDTDHKLPLAIYTPYHLGATNISALGWYLHYNHTVRPHAIHPRSPFEQDGCTDWMHDYIGGWASCQHDHKLDSYKHEHDLNKTRSAVFELLVSALYNHRPDSNTRSKCLVTPYDRVCVSWPQESMQNNGLSLDAIVKITEFATACAVKHGASSQHMVDDLHGLWTRSCVSNEPENCHPGLCAQPDKAVRLPADDWLAKKADTQVDTTLWLMKYVPWWFGETVVPSPRKPCSNQECMSIA